MKSSPATICVPVCVRRASELPDAIGRAAAMADVVEVRLDYLDESERETALPFLLENRARTQMILTCRSPEQGGHAALDFESRYRIWASLIRTRGRSVIDLELDLVLRFAAEEVAQGLPIEWAKVICSHHDFQGVPTDLDQIYERMAATPARVLKIAVQASDATDCLPIFRLLERAHHEGRELIAIAMGPGGVMTRILGPSRGSFLTYGAFDDHNATAPGQLTARELREVYRIGEIKQAETRVFGLIGKPVGHSLSPHIHNAAFEHSAASAVYLPFEVSDAGQFMRRMVHPRSRELDWNLHGLSVTAPHKSTVLNCLDWTDEAAKEMDAVNTIVIRGDQLHGHNTDAAGFIAPLKSRFGSLRGARCAVIGAGGSARAALWAFGREESQVVLFVREPEKARLVAERFNLDSYPLSAASFSGFDVVVNATPLGTRGVHEQDTAATADQLRGVRLAYDLVYNPLETRFLCEARAAGCETLGGIEMLLGQAVEQFKLWTGSNPDVEVMRAAALRALG